MFPLSFSNSAAYALNFLFTFALGTPNAIGSALGFQSNKYISDKYPTLVTPSGWAFSIWGPIFLLEGYSVLISTSLSSDVSFWWKSTCVLQAAWTVCFGLGSRREFVALSTPLIVGIAYCTRAMYTQTINDFDIGLECRVAFALHAAWTSAAALVNLSLVARAYSIDGQAQLRLALVSEIGAFALSAYTSYSNSDPVYTLVTAWALLAIGLNQGTRTQKKNVGISPAALVSVGDLSMALGSLSAIFGAGLLVGFGV
jgi:benzodiazapine receptor